LALRGVSDANKEAIVDKINKINVIKAEIEATKELTAEEIKNKEAQIASLEGEIANLLPATHIGMKIGTAVITSFTTAIASFSQSRQAQSFGDMLGTTITSSLISAGGNVGEKKDTSKFTILEI
jgi:hypothetical protein